MSPVRMKRVCPCGWTAVAVSPRGLERALADHREYEHLRDRVDRDQSRTEKGGTEVK